MKKQTKEDTLAIHGGVPVRAQMLPYGGQWLSQEDIDAVVAVLRSDWLTTGPKVAEFEQACCRVTQARDAVAVSSGTAALHAAVNALGIGPGDEVIVPAVTFAASANCVVYEGGTPVFADVDPGTLLLDPDHVEARLTARTRAIVAVDYAGQPCDYEALRGLASRRGLALIADACHALGARERGRPAGTLADATAFSFHPVKHITTGEGGLVATDRPELAARMRAFRNHGIARDASRDAWLYDVATLGYNYRLTDLQCALGISQLSKLEGWLARRRQIAGVYDAAFAGIPGLAPLVSRPDVEHAYHLYVVRVDRRAWQVDRATIFAALRSEGIGVNVHYIPVHLHSFYRTRFGTHRGLCPVAEAAYEELISLPIFPRMDDDDVADVIAAVRKVAEAYLS